MVTSPNRMDGRASCEEASVSIARRRRHLLGLPVELAQGAADAELL